MILYMISYVEITWMLSLFSFPAYMACNVGYLIPISQATASSSLSIEEPATEWHRPWFLSTISSTCAALKRSASRERRYCRWPSRECDWSTVRYSSLSFVQSARRFQLSIWLCSGLEVFAMIKDFWFPVHFQLWIQIVQLKVKTLYWCAVFSHFAFWRWIR